MAKKRQIIFPSDISIMKEKSIDVSLTSVDKKLEEERYQPNDKINKVEKYESDDDLTRRLIQIIKSQEIPDLLGVFGVYYDNKVKRSVNLLKEKYSEVLYFTIDIDYEEMDIYNCITLVLYNYLNEKGYSIHGENFSYYAHEIIKSFVDYGDTSSMDVFERFEINMQLVDRTKNMEILINSFFKHLQLFSTKIIIFINLNSAFLSNKMLQMLEKITNKNMIFILGSLQNEEAQINHLDTMSINMGRDLFSKYFYPQNIFNSPRL